MGQKLQRRAPCFARRSKNWLTTACNSQRRIRESIWLPTHKPAMRSIWPFSILRRRMRCRGLSNLQATTLALDLGQLRTLLVAESISSISKPMLIVVGCWLVVIFLGFTVIAPRNATATTALMMSALSAAAAIFLILELDRPFSGVLRISNEPMLNVLNQLAQRNPCDSDTTAYWS